MTDHKKKKKSINDGPTLVKMAAVVDDDEYLTEPRTTVNLDSSSDNGFPGWKDISDQDTIIQMQDFNNVLDVPSTNNRRIVDVTTEKLNSRAMSIFGDARKDLGPIIGYANEPLLPLVKACAPLVNIIPNLPKYVQAALNETPEQPLDGLTIDESAAIRLYTMQWEKSYRSLYAILNYTLKNCDREQLKPYFKYLKLFLTALVKLPCVPPLTIWRGVTKNLSDEFLPGTQVNWWAFSSCTSELTVLHSNVYLGNSGDRTLFSVEAINARKIDGHSHFIEENEVLLLPGTQMIVQSQGSPAENLHIIHLKQVIPQEILLELPFEGNFNTFDHLFIKTDFLYLGAYLYPKPE